MDNILSWIKGFDFSRLIELLLSAAAAVTAISIHECSHGLMAYWLGDDTAKRQGRLSLNPFRHLDWVGFIMLAVFRFGWARPVQVDMRRFKNPKTGMACVALAGPLSNVLLALLAAILSSLLIEVGLHSEVLARISGELYVLNENWLYYLVLLFLSIEAINIGLAIFNLIPIPPLDGSKVLAVLLPDRLHSTLMRVERYGMFLLVALLFTGVLDTPLNFLRSGLTAGLDAIAEPIAALFAKLIY